MERTVATPMSRSRSARCQKEIAAASATSTSEAATCQSSTWIEVLKYPLDRPASVAQPAAGRTTQSPRRRACSGSWLTSTSEIRARGAAAPASPRSRRGRRGRAPRSARRGGGPAGRWASARASIARCCSPTESLATSRSAKVGIEAGERAAFARASSSLAGELGRVAQVRLDRALEQRRQLRHQRDLAAQRQRLVLGRAAGRGRRSRRGRGRRAGSAAAAASTCRRRRGRRSPSPRRGSRRRSESRTARPPRSRPTSRSSKSTADIPSATHTLHEAARLRALLYRAELWLKQSG